MMNTECYNLSCIYCEYYSCTKTATCNMRLVKPKHGRWIDNTGVVGWPKWICSVCGGDGRGDYKICPWCGAIMDDEIGEDPSHPFAESVMMGKDEEDL